MNDFWTLPAGAWQQTLTVQKSRFIAFATRVNSATEAQAFIKKVALPDATHHCYAYLTADGQKSNDNGEPAGTAGLPILQAIKSAELSHVVVVVERYFGGIKLGTGGLARAYGQAATQVLSAVKPVLMRDCVVLEFTSNYEQQTAIQQLLTKYSAQGIPTYQADIVWRVSVPQNMQTQLQQALGEIMRTAPVVKIIAPHAWVEFPA
ncbi:MAG: YigZ family protein [Eubacteriales bacterium]|nr:YigZ family protein [Eubacteriales bacterium]